jgi:hypothetical protein
MTNELCSIALLGAFAPELDPRQKNESEQDEDDEDEKSVEKEIEETTEGYSE